MVTLVEARLPEGLRIYAVGDLHGRRDLLERMQARIARDLDARPVADWRVIYLGDYIDRGAESAQVLAMLAEGANDSHVLFLRGNHDQFLIDFLAGEGPRGWSEGFDLWMYNGGAETLDSFGIDGAQAAYETEPVELERLRDRLAGALAPGVAEFLDGLHWSLRFGDYIFVHAGLRPGVTLDAQEQHDLVWIREPFLSDPSDHGAVVVHGHTPVEEVDIRPNRIGIDTGAVFTGKLTCLVLEGSTRKLLSDGWLEPLREG
jgi:serine/threonine protein phosphatase 1